jgi:peptidoglycan/xylan/chitin deacetylase (PgdA/CDA1 family)
MQGMIDRQAPSDDLRLPASISLDLDNLWAYLKTHGDAAWSSYPGFLDTAVPRFLQFFERRRTAITVFVVGKDAELPSNQPLLRSIADAGHEIGNHSYWHEPWLQRCTREQLVAEIEQSEKAIHAATGKTTTGFRGPGFSYSDELLRLLLERNYQYDASTFPTFLGPVARGYYFLKSRFDRAEKEQRKQLFGKFVDGFQANKPYCWSIGGKRLLEIPVTTMPLFKLPIHASYLMYLASFSPLLARAWFWQASKLCAITGTAPSLLLHALDFLDEGDVPELGFFPGMKCPVSRKIDILHRCVDMIERHWQPGTLLEHARYCQTQTLPNRSLETAAKAPCQAVATG